MSQVINRRWSDIPPSARFSDSCTTQRIVSKSSKDLHCASTKVAHIPRTPVHLFLTTTYVKSTPKPQFPLQIAEFKENIKPSPLSCSSNHLTQPEMAATVNGNTYPVSESIPHQMEKDLPGGGNWVVQKFGGTSVGKFALNIAEIARYVRHFHRV